MSVPDGAPPPNHPSTTGPRLRVGAFLLFNVALLLLGIRALRTQKQHGSLEAARATIDPNGALLASAAAFDLCATTSGALLAWAPKNSANGAVRVAKYRPDGSLEKPARELVSRGAVDGNIEELALATLPQDRVALAMLERHWGALRILAAEGSAHEPLRPSELGPSGAPARGERGNLALGGDASRTDAISLLARAGDAECVDSGKRECTAFAWWRLTKGHAESRGFPLSVPSPCPEHAISLLNEPRGLHYAVCSQAAEGGERNTTLFTIQNSPEYARADPLLKGCQPLGLFATDESVWLLADCNGKRRAARAGADNAAVEQRDVASPRLECVNGRALVHAGPIETSLLAARSGLEVVLPSALAPKGSRAVWSGAALLVAAPRAGKLELTRYACDGNTLRQISRASDPAR